LAAPQAYHEIHILDDDEDIRKKDSPIDNGIICINRGETQKKPRTLLGKRPRVVVDSSDSQNSEDDDDFIGRVIKQRKEHERKK